MRSSPYRTPAPAPRAPRPSWTASTTLELGLGERAPPLCLSCGSRRLLRAERRTFRWVPPGNPWLPVTLLLVATLLRQRSATLDIWICGACAMARRRSRCLLGAAIACPVLLSALVLVFVTPRCDVDSGVCLVLLTFAVIALVVTGPAVVVHPRLPRLRAERIDERGILLCGVAPEALASLADPGQAALGGDSSSH